MNGLSSTSKTSGPLVGRGALLDTILSRHRQARAGAASALLLRGEAGVGKTSLLAHAAELMRRDAGLVACTAVLDYARSPFAPIIAVLGDLLRARPGEAARSAALIAAIGVAERRDEADSAPGAAERRRFFDLVAHAFRIAAESEPLTLVIDDLHDADPSTLQLLYHVLDAMQGRRFFLLASYRAGSDGALGEQWLRLARLNRLAHVAQAELAPLDDEGSAALIRHAAEGRLPREVRERIAHAAEGNPLFARELVTAAVGGDERAAIPRSIAEAVLDRVRMLGEDERECLRMAACIGREFDDDVLAELVSQPLARVHAALRSARSFGLVDETPEISRFRFHHAMTREAIYSDMLGAERRTAHRRIFELLNARPQTVQQIPMLALQAHAARDRRGTVFYNEIAGDRAFADRAFESAVAHWMQAREAVDEPAHAAALHRKAAAAWMAAGFPDRAAVPALQALDFYRGAQQVEHFVDMLLLLADAAGQVGNDERRLELMAQVDEQLMRSEDSRHVTKRALCTAEIALADRHSAAVLRATEPALRFTASEIGIPDVLALRNVRAQALLMDGQFHAAIDEQRHAAEIAAELGTADHVYESQFGLGIVCALSGEPRRAAEAFGAAAAAAGVRLAMTERALSIAHQAEMKLIVGEVDAARSLLDEALPHAGRRDHPALTVELGRVGLFLGMRTDDSALLERIVDVLELHALFADGTPERYFPLSGAYAQYLAGIGKTDSAREVLRRAVGRLSHRRLRSTDWSVCSMMTVAAVGDEADVPRARAQIAEWFAPYAPAFVSLFDALLADRAGDAREAAAQAERAVPGFNAFGFRYEEGMSLALADRKTEALQIFKEFGARADVARVREALTPRNRQGRPANELTAREREVAELAAEGLRNRSISDRLSISEKTVETHLASIFTKFGVRSRAEIAARLAQREDAL